jgi:N-acetylated-alpha-linked acidic dipeptidase
VKLLQAERQLTDEAGLPKRPWYRHLLYAPGFYTGYAVKTMPGVREAIEQKQYAEADTEIARVAKAVEREAALLDSISSSLP